MKIIHSLPFLFFFFLLVLASCFFLWFVKNPVEGLTQLTSHSQAYDDLMKAFSERNKVNDRGCEFISDPNLLQTKLTRYSRGVCCIIIWSIILATWVDNIFNHLVGTLAAVWQSSLWIQSQHLAHPSCCSAVTINISSSPCGG